jgi:hypothetical protein
MSKSNKKRHAKIPEPAPSSLAKWPRQYAAEIIAEGDIDRRREMLAAVPQDYRELTETHVLNNFKLRAYESKRDSKRPAEG